MFNRKMIGALVAGAAIAGFGVTMAFAAADDAIKSRQACMKAHGAEMGVMGPMFKGEKPYDAAAIKAALDATAAACADWDKWWGEDTQKGETVETFAKPEVWTDAEGWKAAGGKWYEANTAVAAAADEAAFKAAFPALGASCGGCHEKFRRPKG
jgi:cytochrome c556